MVSLIPTLRVPLLFDHVRQNILSSSTVGASWSERAFANCSMPSLMSWMPYPEYNSCWRVALHRFLVIKSHPSGWHVNMFHITTEYTSPAGYPRARFIV